MTLKDTADVTSRYCMMAAPVYVRDLYINNVFIIKINVSTQPMSQVVKLKDFPVRMLGYHPLMVVQRLLSTDVLAQPLTVIMKFM